jgi:hypothetical protein
VSTDKEKEITYTAREQAILDAYEALKDKTEADLKDQQTSIENAYARSLSTYGANAERLRSQGFTTGQQGGYSTFLDAEANRIRRQQNDDAIKAYNSLMQEATMKKDDALLQLDTEKKNAYANILTNISQGAYADQSQINAAKSAYESLYGKLDEGQNADIEKAYAGVAAAQGITTDPEQWSSDKDTRAVQLNASADAFSAGMGDIITQVASGTVAYDSAALTIDQLLAEYDKVPADDKAAYKARIDSQLPTVIAKYLTTATDETKTSVQSNAIQLAKKLDETMGGTVYTDRVIESIKSGFKTGADFSYLGSSAPWREVPGEEGHRYDANDEKDNTWINFGGEKFTIKVLNESEVDESTQIILDSLLASYGLTEKANAAISVEEKGFDPKEGGYSKHASENEAGYAVAYNNEIYFYSKLKGWKKVERSSSEIKRLRKMGVGDNSSPW